MTSEWYGSFHGGDEGETLNNIHVYSSDGRELRKALNTKSLAAGVTLRELRGFVFGPDRNLYVVNSYYEYSEVLKFKAALNNDGQHEQVLQPDAVKPRTSTQRSGGRRGLCKPLGLTTVKSNPATPKIMRNF
jgi:hypothetical protein